MSQWEISASWMGATCQRLPWAGRILQAGEGDIQTQKGSSTVGRSWESAGDWGEAHPRFLECPRLSGSRLAQRVEINKPRSQNSCAPMFIAALFTIARTWKQPKCPSTDEWIKKMWYVYTMEYYAAIKKNEIMPFAATWMDLETVILNELRQRKRNII